MATPTRQTLPNRLRCVAAWLAWSVITIGMALLMLALFWLPQRVLYRCARFWCRMSIHIFRIVIGIRYQLSGLKNLKLDTPCIIAANHESSWETQALMALLPPLAWVLKVELLWVPFFGQALYLTRPIIIQRRMRMNSLHKIIKRGRSALHSGRWVAIFPQGTRQPGVKQPRMHISTALLAQKTRRPIVPVVHNSGNCWLPGALNKRPGLIRVQIGEPILPTHSDGSERKVREIHSQMVQSLHRMRSELDS